METALSVLSIGWPRSACQDRVHRACRRTYHVSLKASCCHVMTGPRMTDADGGEAFQSFLLPDGNGNHANLRSEDLTTARWRHQWWRQCAHGEQEVGALAHLQPFLSPGTVISPGRDQLEKSRSIHPNLKENHTADSSASWMMIRIELLV